MPSLLATALELERVLLNQIQRPAPPPPLRPASLHPLALATNQPKQALDDLADTVRASIATIRTGISQFPLSLQANLDPNDDLDSSFANNPARLARDRYLTQLREAANSEAALHTLASRADANGRITRKRKTRARDDRWSVATPHSHGVDGSTVKLLETIAADLDLVTFRDDDEGGGGDTVMTGPTGAVSTVKSVTLSVGGKVMVVDFTLVGTRVDRVKVAYVIAGQDRQSAFAAKKLEGLFALVQANPSAPADGSAGDGNDDAREQKCWKGVRRVLEELKALDEESERTGRDAFEEVERLVQDLSVQLARNSHAGSGSESRFILAPFDSLYPVLVYHAAPAARLSTAWQRVLALQQEPANGFDLHPRQLPPASADVQALLSPQHGIYSVQFELASELSQAISAQSAASDAASKTKSSPLFLATLEPALPIYASTGRSILAALGLGHLPSAAFESKQGPDGQDSKTDHAGQSPLDSEPQDRSASALPSWLDLVSSQIVIPQSHGPPASDTVFEQTVASEPRPLLLQSRLPSPTNASDPTPPGFLASYLPFTDLANLVSTLPHLAAQATLNELLASALQPRFGVTVRQRTREGVASGQTGSKKTAPRDPDELTLEELLAPPAPDAPLIVSVSLSSSNGLSSAGTNGTTSSEAEVLVVSFPFPALANAPASLLALPISLAISCIPPSEQPDATNAIPRVVITAPAAVLQHLGSAEERAELERRAGRILHETGIVGFAIEAVVKALEARN